MKVVAAISKDVLNDWQEQTWDKYLNYRLIKYHKFLDVEEGVLFYNLLTYELIIITQEEKLHLLNNTLCDYNKMLYRYLIGHWYLIPEEYDEKTLAYIQRSAHKYKGLFYDKLTQYTILTTTDCNARCYYCYEKGAKRISMTEQTANDVADYIIAHSEPDRRIHLSWFGGEPLFNSKAIDIICQKLHDAGMNYWSSMISNAYLFDAEMVKKADELWHLERVQITVDGMPRTYKKVKAYIYKDDNPFSRIMENVRLLMSQNIQCNIRFNVSEDNLPDLYIVVDYLSARFSDCHKLTIHVAPLFEDIENNLLTRTEKEREYIYTEAFKVEDYIQEKGFLGEPLIKLSSLSTIQCMADNPGSIIISPEGKLGLCEHHIEDDFYGTIYSDPMDHDYDVIRNWKQLAPDYPECKDCFYYPRCIRLDKCATNKACNDMVRIEVERRVERIMRNTYRKYKNHHMDDVKKFVEM